jgi:hypothetical protein
MWTGGYRIEGMTIGGLGKALANQAIESTKKSVIDAVNPADAAKAAKPAEATLPDLCAIIVGQIQAMQRPLGENQELAVTFRAGDEMLRVTEILVPNAQLLIFVGADAEGNVTRVISPAETAQVICKVKPVTAGMKPVRVNVLTPKPQPKPAA